MNVSTEDIKNIPAGELKLFPCEDGGKIKSARSLVSIFKERGDFPDGVVNYETKKFELETGLVFAIRAMREGDVPVLNITK
jgi:hypothetical protein